MPYEKNLLTGETTWGKRPRVIDDLISAMKIPGEVYRGETKVDPSSDEFMGRLLGLGTIAMPGTLPSPGMRVVPRPPASTVPNRRIPLHRRSTSGLDEFSSEIASVLDSGVSSKGKLFREDLGEITIDFGTPGDPTKKYRGGWGLSHIRDKRASTDALDGDRFVRDILPQILHRGRLSYQVTPRGRRSAVLDLGDYVANLRLDRHGQRETWVVTSFKKKETPR